MKNIGGISAIFQWAFDGYSTARSTVNSDIYFNYSNNLLDKKNKSTNYNVSVGYVMDYAFDLLKDDAKKLRN